MATIWTSVTTAVTNLLTIVGDVAETIIGNEYIALFALVIPLVSFGRKSYAELKSSKIGESCNANT